MQTPEDFLEANGFACESIDRSALVSMFIKEMEAGLKGEASSLAMIPTYVSPNKMRPPENGQSHFSFTDTDQRTRFIAPNLHT